MRTLKQIQELTGIDGKTLYTRIKNQRKTAEQAVEMGASQKSLITYAGQEYTKAVFLEKFKISRKQFYKNYKEMTTEEIVIKFGSGKK